MNFVAIEKFAGIKLNPRIICQWEGYDVYAPKVDEKNPVPIGMVLILVKGDTARFATEDEFFAIGEAYPDEDD